MKKSNRVSVGIFLMVSMFASAAAAATRSHVVQDGTGHVDEIVHSLQLSPANLQGKTPRGVLRRMWKRLTRPDTGWRI
jgi:hypothetical protein